MWLLPNMRKCDNVITDNGNMARQYIVEGH